MLKNGTKYNGVLDSIDPTNIDCCFRTVMKQNEPKKIVSQMNFLGKDIASISILNYTAYQAPKRPTQQFKTDTSISKSSGTFKERVLQKWTPDVDSPAPELLEDNQSGQAWDQFAVNEQKFGVTTDFNEDMYTTVLDRSGKDFKKKELEAAKLAREIERKSTGNVHIAEERGQNTIGPDDNEEDKYSSVIRTGADEIKADATKSPRPAHLSSIAKSVLKRSANEQVVKLPIRKDNAVSQKQEPRSAVTINTPALQELNKSFKSFGKNLKKHIIKHHATKVYKEDREELIADLKKFSVDFQIPETLKSENASKESLNAQNDHSRPDIVSSQPIAIPVSKADDTMVSKSLPNKSSASNTLSEVTKVEKNSVEVEKDLGKRLHEHRNSISNVSEADSNATNNTTKSKSSFKLSAAAQEFTPSGNFVPIYRPKDKSSSKGLKSHGAPPRPCNCILIRLF
jgi:PAB1-binding protein PBP1